MRLIDEACLVAYDSAGIAQYALLGVSTTLSFRKFKRCLMDCMLDYDKLFSWSEASWRTLIHGELHKRHASRNSVGEQ